METKQLHAAKLAVMEKVRRVEKTRTMQGGGSYKYAGLEEIISDVRPVMVTNGLTIAPIKVEPLHIGSYTLKSGANMNHCIYSVTFRLMHSSGEYEDLQSAGEGADTQDKTSNKAQSAALKYVLLQTFLLQGAHDDPDDYPSQEQAPAKTQRTAKQETKPDVGPPAPPTAEASGKLALVIVNELNKAGSLERVKAIKERANGKRQFLLPADQEAVRKKIETVTKELEQVNGRQPGDEPG